MARNKSKSIGKSAQGFKCCYYKNAYSDPAAIVFMSYLVVPRQRKDKKCKLRVTLLWPVTHKEEGSKKLKVKSSSYIIPAVC
jgi:hypothetical protein